MGENKERIDRACKMAEELVGDFVMMSRESPEEMNIADELMGLRNLLFEIYEKGSN